MQRKNIKSGEKLTTSTHRHECLCKIEIPCHPLWYRYWLCKIDRIKKISWTHFIIVVHSQNRHRNIAFYWEPFLELNSSRWNIVSQNETQHYLPMIIDSVWLETKKLRKKCHHPNEKLWFNYDLLPAFVQRMKQAEKSKTIANGMALDSMTNCEIFYYFSGKQNRTLKLRLFRQFKWIFWIDLSELLWHLAQNGVFLI